MPCVRGRVSGGGRDISDCSWVIRSSSLLGTLSTSSLEQASLCAILRAAAPERSKFGVAFSGPNSSLVFPGSSGCSRAYGLRIKLRLVVLLFKSLTHGHRSTPRHSTITLSPAAVLPALSSVKPPARAVCCGVAAPVRGLRGADPRRVGSALHSPSSFILVVHFHVRARASLASRGAESADPYIVES